MPKSDRYWHLSHVEYKFYAILKIANKQRIDRHPRLVSGHWRSKTDMTVRVRRQPVSTRPDGRQGTGFCYTGICGRIQQPQTGLA